MNTNNRLCNKPWESILVSVSGDCTFCCWMYGCIGNLNNSTIEEIWNSDAANHIRDSIDAGKFPKECTIGITCPSRGKK